MTKHKTVFVSGNFNILHPGHLRLLRFARELGEKLIVGVHSDRIGGQGVHIPQQLRLEGVKCNNWVSEALLVDEPVTDILARLKPDVVVKGKEFEDAYNPELEVLEAYGGRLVFSSGDVAFSSVDLIRKSFSSGEAAIQQIPSSFSHRHGFINQDLHSVVEGFSDLKVCVIGDLIIDEYITCDPLGMSQEDPCIVVKPVDTQKFVGGAGIVAAHAAGLGAKVQLISVGGKDAVLEFAQSALEDYGVEAHLFVDENRPTTLKQRYRAQNKTLLRVSHLHQGSVGKALQERMLKQITDSIKGFDLLVFADFNYGCLPQVLVNELVAAGKRHQLTMAADSQCSSQIGDISRFQDMHLITPTEREVRVSLRNQEDGLAVIAERLRVQAKAKNIMLKLGAEGVLLHMNNGDQEPFTDRLPALNNSPLDVAGAGDSMLISAGMSLAGGANPWQAAAIGSIAAALQVSRLGNTPLQREEFIRTLLYQDSVY